MRLKVDRDRLQEFKSAIDDRMSIKEFLVLKGELSAESNHHIAHCYKHSDTTPSMYFSWNKNSYYCHSCNNCGGYISFVKHYLLYREDTPYTDEDVIEMVLYNFPDRFEDLKFRTIYALNTEKVTSYTPRKRIEFDKYKETLTWVDLYEKYKDESNQDKLEALSMLQNGIPYREIIGGTATDRTMVDDLVRDFILETAEEGDNIERYK